jgi:hypothetical protein
MMATPWQNFERAALQTCSCRKLRSQQKPIAGFLDENWHKKNTDFIGVITNRTDVTAQ